VIDAPGVALLHQLALQPGVIDARRFESAFGEIAAATLLLDRSGEPGEALLGVRPRRRSLSMELLGLGGQRFDLLLGACASEVSERCKMLVDKLFANAVSSAFSRSNF